MNETVLEENITVSQLSKPISRRIYFIIKRLFDIFASLLGCIFLLPIAIIVKICTLLSGDTKKIF